MDFQRLRIVNFLTIGDSGDILLANRGLNLLQGQNDDDPSATSNGSGKSSVPDALCWALFGTTARGDSGDAVVNDSAKKDCMVSVDLKDGSTCYTVRRYRKHKEFKNGTYLTQTDAAGAIVDLTKGTEKETQLVIAEIMGCSFEVFMAAIYAGQEQMPDLPAMTDKELKLLIEEAAGVQKLERAYEIARSRENDLKRRSEDVSTHITRMQGWIHSSNVGLEDAKLKHAAFETERAPCAQALFNSADLEKRAAETLIASIQKQDEPAIVADLKETQEALQAIQGKQQAVATYQRSTLQPATQEEAVLRSQHRAALDEATKVRSTYDNAATEFLKPCNHCGKPHTADELELFKEHTKTRLVAAVKAAKHLGDRLTVSTGALTAVQAELTRLQGLVPDASDLSARLTTLNTMMAGIARLKSDARAALERCKSRRAQGEAVLVQPNPQQALIEAVLQKIAEQTKELATLEATGETLRAQLDVATIVSKVFSPAGVRAHILDTVTPFLNDRTAEYLSTLSDGNISAVWSTLSKTAKGELREKFVIDVENDKGGKSFRSLSGGEKRKVRLATMMALQDLVASRATKPLNLWIGDEVDDALDAAGLERLMTILERKAREKGTVLVISHNELRDWIDAVTVVRKQGGKSSVEGALLTV